MRFFVDTADIREIAYLAGVGVLDGVTTNPSLVAKTGRSIHDVIAEICQLVEGPVSAEVTATSFEDMVAQGERLAGIAANVAIKVPSTWDGFRACRTLCQQAARSMLRCASQPIRRCSPPRRARPTFLPLSGGSMT